VRGVDVELGGKFRRPPQVIEVQRRLFDRASLTFALDQHGHGASLDEKDEQRPTNGHNRERCQERCQDHWMRQQRRNDGARHLAPFEAQQILGRGADHQTHEKQTADERGRNEQLEQRISGRLDECDLPIGGRYKRTALEHRSEERGAFHWRLPW